MERGRELSLQHRGAREDIGECHSLRDEGKHLPTFSEGRGMNENPPVCCNPEWLVLITGRGSTASS